MFGMKSKAEKEKEIEGKIKKAVGEVETKYQKEREERYEAEKKVEREKAQLEMEKCRKKYKTGLTFKYLELNMILEYFYFKQWTTRIMVKAKYIKDGEVVTENIELELFINLIKL